MGHDPHPQLNIRASVDTQSQLHECQHIARLMGISGTINAVLRRALKAHGIQLRRRARQAGIDVDGELAAFRARSGKVSGKVATPFKGVAEKPEPRVYGG